MAPRAAMATLAVDETELSRVHDVKSLAVPGLLTLCTYNRLSDGSTRTRTSELSPAHTAAWWKLASSPL